MNKKLEHSRFHSTTVRFVSDHGIIVELQAKLLFRSKTLLGVDVGSSHMKIILLSAQ